MPRTPRLLLPSSNYHIMTRGNNRNIVFKSENDYEYYLYLLRKYKEELPFDLYHYCLMSNHVHLLVRTRKAKDFSLFMKKINLAYFHYFRQHYGWIGHFWQDRYKSQPVGKDEYFIQCGKYIELNPVRKKIIDDPADYRYSSYKYYAYGEKNDLITTDMMYDDESASSKDKQENYRNMLVDEIIVSSYLN